jgi:mRNA-degrading endonuclease RelE of RelBE toxin-antitoxin system
MSYNVKTIDVFERQAKRLIKKYASLKNEIAMLITELKEDPQQGISIGKNCYKIKISIASKGKGKSGGARIITNLVVSENNVYLLSIYDKSERDNLSDKEIQELLKELPR